MGRTDGMTAERNHLLRVGLIRRVGKRAPADDPTNAARIADHFDLTPAGEVEAQVERNLAWLKSKRRRKRRVRHGRPQPARDRPRARRLLRVAPRLQPDARPREAAVDLPKYLRWRSRPARTPSRSRPPTSCSPSGTASATTCCSDRRPCASGGRSEKKLATIAKLRERTGVRRPSSKPPRSSPGGSRPRSNAVGWRGVFLLRREAAARPPLRRAGVPPGRGALRRLGGLLDAPPPRRPARGPGREGRARGRALAAAAGVEPGRVTGAGGGGAGGGSPDGGLPAHDRGGVERDRGLAPDDGDGADADRDQADAPHDRA